MFPGFAIGNGIQLLAAEPAAFAEPAVVKIKANDMLIILRARFKGNSF